MEGAMAGGLRITLDTDHTKAVVVKDHEGNPPIIVPVRDPHSPIQTLVHQGIVAVQTATIVWTKSSPDRVCYLIGGNWHCFG